MVSLIENVKLWTGLHVEPVMFLYQTIVPTCIFFLMLQCCHISWYHQGTCMLYTHTCMYIFFIFCFYCRKNTHIQVIQVQNRNIVKQNCTVTHTHSGKSPPPPTLYPFVIDIQLFSFKYFQNKFWTYTYKLNFKKSGFPFMSFCWYSSTSLLRQPY